MLTCLAGPCFWHRRRRSTETGCQYLVVEVDHVEARAALFGFNQLFDWLDGLSGFEFVERIDKRKTNIFGFVGDDLQQGIDRFLVV